MSFVVGIDVGTTFTGIAAARGAGSGGMVKLGRRQHVMPSVVWIGSDPGELSVGESAVRRMTSDPANVASLFKRDVGSDTPWRLGGRDVPVEELIGHLVEHALKVAESEHGGRAERVALTFPAAWGPLRQGVLVGGAQRAGIDAPLLVTEPEAAAAFYASERPVPDDALVAVFDFGGGTLDIAVVHRVEGGFELLGNPTGDDDLGGSNIDELLFEHVLGELDESVRAELDVDLAAQTALFWACVDAKEVLSFDPDVEVACVTASGRRGITVTRQHLESLIAPLVDRSLAVLRAGLASAEVREEELYSVLLVGGTSRIPAIADRLGEVLPCAIAVDTDPKTSVSLGAARLAMAELAELDSSQALGDTVDLRIPGLGRGTFVGRGGYSVVYRARQESLDRDVAVKLIIGAGFDLTARRRFEQECQAIGRLSEHPNIVNVYQSGVPDDGPAFLVMSYVPNGSYQDELDAGSTLSWQRAAEVGTKIANALEAAHQAGIFHCDVKPANVLLSAHGEPLLADFGLARAAERTATQSITGLAGTPHYSPPEVFDGVSPAPSRDVYGLAATVHALITGGPPIESETDSILALMRQIAHVEPVDLRQFDVPDPVAEVVAKGLAKEADDRYATAEEFGTALANGAERAAAFTTAADTEHPPPSKESKPLPLWLRWAVPVAVVAVVIAALVLRFGGSGDGEAVETTLLAGGTPVTEPDSSAPATPSAVTGPSTVPDVDVEDVEGAPFNATAEVGSAFSIASDGRFGGRSFEAVDGLGLDIATGRLIAAKEPATAEIAASDPARADPAIFSLDLDWDSPAAGMTVSPIASLVGPDGSVYGTELDIEGLLVLGDGSVMVVSEGSGEGENTAGPFVHRFDRGEYVGELTLPSWILPSVDGTSGFPPGNGPHGVALLPGSPGEVVVIMETSLQQDLDAGDGRIVRLIAFDVATGEPTRQWGYRLEPRAGGIDGAIVDMAAVDGRSLVVVERDGSVEPGRRALYRIELDAGVEPGDSVPPIVEKHLIDVAAASSFSEIRWSSISSGRRTADGNPTIVLMSNTNFASEPTVGLVLELITSS